MTVALTYLYRRVDSSTSTLWASPFPVEGVSDCFFFLGGGGLLLLPCFRSSGI